MTQAIKAIDTLYDGHYFRSRTEARWAVFFNALGIKYEYEPAGYKLEDGTCYLPDFWLPEVHDRYHTRKGIWFEVKGTAPDDVAYTKMELLCKLLGDGETMCGIIAIGAPGSATDECVNENHYSYNPNTLEESSWNVHAYDAERPQNAGYDNDMKLCRCAVCGKLHFVWNKWDRYDCCDWPKDWAGEAGGKGWQVDNYHWNLAVKAAVEKSIKARFEHGAKG